MTFDLLWRFSALLFGLIIIGTVCCLPLFKWNLKKLLDSSLFTKIVWWIPIFIVLIAILYGQLFVAIVVTSITLLLAFREFIKNKAFKSSLAWLYFILFCLLMLHLILWFLVLPSPFSVEILAAVCIASVLSDVCAFFFGNYLGKHHLPSWLNDRKSWEGVIGQLVGAFIGAALAYFILQITLPIILVAFIGISSAFGDLFNSLVKRKLHIKDWGNTIPGHGGILDRLSSLSYALAVSFWYVIL